MQQTPETVLARYVQSERKRRGWSQRDLAERLGKVGMDIHATGITRLERGERSIRFNEFVALCNAFEQSAFAVIDAMGSLAEFGIMLDERLARLDKPPGLFDTLKTIRFILRTSVDLIDKTVVETTDEEDGDGVDQ